MDHRETITAITPKGTRKAMDQSEDSSLLGKLKDDERKKPPLQPPSRRTYYTRSVCTKSTASTTYLSSDSEDDNDNNDNTQDYTCSDDGSFVPAHRHRRSDLKRRPARITRSQSERGLSSKSNLDYFTTNALVSSNEFRSNRSSSLQTDSVESTYQDEDVYNLTSDDSSVESFNDDEMVDFPDLDTLISESSTRWKSDVQTTVSKSSTAAFLQKSNVLPSALRRTVPPSSPQPHRLLRSVSDSTTPSALVVASPNYPRRTNSSTAATKLIEEQHQEIERLKALLRPNQGLCSDIVLSGFTPNRTICDAPDNYKVSCIAYPRTMGYYLQNQPSTSLPIAPSNYISSGPKSSMIRNRTGTYPEKLISPRNHSLQNCAPFEHIEVRLNEDNDDINSCCWNDDLTVGSSFTALVTISDKRPDADQDQPYSPSSLKLTKTNPVA